jgi:GT2 family glycosyltransferase
MKLSIVTAVHNQLSMNRIYVEELRRRTDLPYELIVVDNASTDGSREFFASQGAVVIENAANYSYPRCQNQGMAVAKGDVVAFLNNDLCFPDHWDTRLLATMRAHDLDVASGCGPENAGDTEVTRGLHRRWHRVKGVNLAIARVTGLTERNLRRMVRWMYGDWERFSEAWYRDHLGQVREGFVGACVVQTRRAIDLLGPWDERVQAADYDLYVRARKRHEEKGDIRPCHVALDVYVHHFMKLTLKSRRPVFADQANLISLEQKWGPEAARLLAHRADAPRG